jgi:hypothetical protein
MSTELPPLPEWTKQDDLGRLLPSEVRVSVHNYGQQCRDAALLEAAAICECDEGANMSGADLAAVLRAKVKER